MQTKWLISLVAMAGLTSAAFPAAAQDITTAAVRTWAGESWRLTRPSLEIFYTIMPKEEAAAAAPASPELSGAVAVTGTLEQLSSVFEKRPEPMRGHRQTEVVTLSRMGVETQIPLDKIESLQFFRQPLHRSPLPPYVAATHFRYSATAVLEDGSRVEGDYVNLGTMVLRGMTPQGRVDIPWQEIENVRFEAAVAEALMPPEATPLQDVFFAFDRAALDNEAKAALDGNVSWLKANPEVRVVVEGHCDERGTNEYNLALGERRATRVRDYLIAAGIDPTRISTISYGEERPFVLGHDESAWRWNRRAHFVVIQ